MREKFEFIIYLDLDLHHGDAVQEAFLYSDSVFTASFHFQKPGFFPGTGLESERGKGSGEGMNMNVALPFECNDQQFIAKFKAFEVVVEEILEEYPNTAIVIQAGADGLATDPHKILKLTDVSFLHAINYLKTLDIPLLCLGGGGYCNRSCAILWTKLTAALAMDDMNELDLNIKEHEYYEIYLPECQLQIK